MTIIMLKLYIILCAKKNVFFMIVLVKLSCFFFDLLKFVELFFVIYM